MQNYRPSLGIPPAVKILLILNAAMYFLSIFVKQSFHVDMANLLGLHLPQSFYWAPWQYITHMFMHGSFPHLFFNMFALLMFGGVIERALGSYRFLFYYLACGIGAGLIQEGVSAVFVYKYASMLPADAYAEICRTGWTLMHQGLTFADPTSATLNALVNTPLVGASGAIYGILLAFGMLFPNQPVYIWFIPVPVKAKWLVVGYVVLELFYGLGGIADNVAHFAHLGGMLVGFIMILYWKKKGTFNGHWFF